MPAGLSNDQSLWTGNYIEQTLALWLAGSNEA